MPGGKQSPVTVGTGFQSDPSAMANRPLAEICKILFCYQFIFPRFRCDTCPSQGFILRWDVGHNIWLLVMQVPVVSLQ